MTRAGAFMFAANVVSQPIPIWKVSPTTWDLLRVAAWQLRVDERLARSGKALFLAESVTRVIEGALLETGQITLRSVLLQAGGRRSVAARQRSGVPTLEIDIHTPHATGRTIADLIAKQLHAMSTSEGVLNELAAFVLIWIN